MAEPSPRPLSLPAAALWAVALWVLEHFCIEFTESARPGAITDIVSLSACVVLATSLVVFAVARLRAPDRPLREILGIGTPGVLGLVLSVAAGVGLRPALGALEDAISNRFPYDDPEALENVQKLLATSRVAIVVGSLVVIPLAREIFFRGVLFGELRRGGSALFAVVATAVLFALFPGDPRAIPSGLVLGLAFGWLRAGTGSVIAPAVANLAYWAVEGIPILRGADPSADVTYGPRWIGAGLATAAFALVALVPASRRPGRVD